MHVSRMHASRPGARCSDTGPLVSALNRGEGRLTADEALEDGQRWVGSGCTELGKPGSGVFRSADGTRQFRMGNGALTGAHAPGVPHVYLEIYTPGARLQSVSNHIPRVD